MSLAEIAVQAPVQFKHRTAFALYSNGRIENRVSYAEFGTLSARFAALFRLLGLQAGSRLMLLSENRPEWPIVFFGAARASLINVPVLTDFSTEQISTIALHAGVSAICITEKTAHKLTHPEQTTPNPSLPLIYIDSIQNNSIRISCQEKLLEAKELLRQILDRANAPESTDMLYGQSGDIDAKNMEEFILTERAREFTFDG